MVHVDLNKEGCKLYDGTKCNLLRRNVICDLMRSNEKWYEWSDEKWMRSNVIFSWMFRVIPNQIIMNPVDCAFANSINLSQSGYLFLFLNIKKQTKTLTDSNFDMDEKGLWRMNVLY